MLDGKIVLFEINNSVNKQSEKLKPNRLIFNSCKAIISDKLFSELDELNFANLNTNDYGLGYIDFEFGFKENFTNPYMKFYASCFDIRTNKSPCPIRLDSIRLNKDRRRFLIDNYTKVDKFGNLAFGIRFFFRSEEERNALLTCECLCIEGSISFGNKHNVYDIMCKLEKDKNGWRLDDAFTYRKNPRTHIDSLIH